MNEMTYVLTAFLGGIFSCIVGGLYSYAGRQNTSKAWRRFGCPVVILGGLIAIKSIEHTMEYHLLTILMLLTTCGLMCLGYCMGYSGRDGVKIALLKRLMIVGIYLLALVPICVLASNYWLLIPHFWLCLYTASFALSNPLKAAKEEFFIGALTSFMIFIGA